MIVRNGVISIARLICLSVKLTCTTLLIDLKNLLFRHVLSGSKLALSEACFAIELGGAFFFRAAVIGQIHILFV